MRITLLLLTGLALSLTTGCSFSDSSGSMSDSISSPSKSISNSSSGDDDEAPAPETPQDTARYRQDVSQLTVTYLKSGGDIGAFTSAISKLAMARGVSDWGADADTNQAIGVGAGTAGLQEQAFDDFGAKLFGNDLLRLNELRKGYQQTAPVPPQVATPPNTQLDGVNTPSTPSDG
jgi:uncharacterized protein YfiM (DUF2279 family)